MSDDVTHVWDYPQCGNTHTHSVLQCDPFDLVWEFQFSGKHYNFTDD